MPQPTSAPPLEAFPLEGGCDCKYIRYRLETAPLIVQCCHCCWCQRETGSAFALNASIEHDRVTLLGAEPEIVDTPSESGRGQPVARCPKCRIAVWSNYAGPWLRFVRVGTLDRPECCPPNVQIYTASKLPWVVLPEGIPAREEYYAEETLWSKESMKRREMHLERMREQGVERKGTE